MRYRIETWHGFGAADAHSDQVGCFTDFDRADLLVETEGLGRMAGRHLECGLGRDGRCVATGTFGQ
jgi:hypothetical protein